MDDQRAAEELAGWLVSPAVRWVRESGLPVALARRGEVLLADQRLAAADERAAGVALLGRWERALSVGGPWRVAELAAAFASWATGRVPTATGAVEDRAVDLMLRAGALAGDPQRFALMRQRPDRALREAHELTAALAHTLLSSTPSDAGVLALELEDAAARGAGVALVALLLAGEAV